MIEDYSNWNNLFDTIYKNTNTEIKNNNYINCYLNDFYTNYYETSETNNHSYLNYNIGLSLRNIFLHYRELLNFNILNTIFWNNNLDIFNNLETNFNDSEYINMKNFINKYNNEIKNNYNDFNKKYINYNENKLTYNNKILVNNKLNFNKLINNNDLIDNIDNYIIELKNNNNEYDKIIEKKNKLISINKKYYKKGELCKSAWIKNIGLNILNYINIYIGDKLISKLDNDYMNIIYKIYELVEDRYDEKYFFGNSNKLQELTLDGNGEANIFINIPLWFNLYNTNCLPIYLFKYSNFKLEYKLKNILDLIKLEDDILKNYIQINNILDFKLNLLTYDIKFDNNFKLNNILKNNQLSLIEESYNQKYNNVNLDSSKKLLYSFNFNIHKLIKTIFIIIKKSNTDDYLDIIDSFSIKSNEFEIFNNINNNINLMKYGFTNINTNIYCYSFSLMPKNFSPSGSCNFEVLNNLKLNIKIKNKDNNNKIINGEYDIHVYVISYNFLKIMSNMATTLY